MRELKARWSQRVRQSKAGLFVRRQAENRYLPGHEGISVYEIWNALLRHLRLHSLFERAAAISFNAVMAIPPTVIFIFTLIPYLPISDRLILELYGLIRDVVPGRQNNTVIIQFLDDFLNRPRNELLSFGLLLAIVFSSNAMMGILRSFDKNYIGFRRRRTLHKRRVALQLTGTVIILVFCCLLLLIAHSAVLKWLGLDNAFWRALIHNLRWVIIFLLFFAIVGFIYRHGPPVLRRWPLINPGSILATTLMVVATTLVSLYIENFSSYNTVYGSIGVVFILMSLIYANALAILLGFELNVTITYLNRQRRQKRKEGARA